MWWILVWRTNEARAMVQVGTNQEMLGKKEGSSSDYNSKELVLCKLADAAVAILLNKPANVPVLAQVLLKSYPRGPSAREVCSLGRK